MAASLKFDGGRTSDREPEVLLDSGRCVPSEVCAGVLRVFDHGVAALRVLYSSGGGTADGVSLGVILAQGLSCVRTWLDTDAWMQ